MLSDAVQEYKVIGLMSGSSLDGLDIAYCQFLKAGASWQFKILASDCIAYSEEWYHKLREAPFLDGRSLLKLDAEYGCLLALLISRFIEERRLSNAAMLIGSHGHTVFHFPAEGFTCQIGNGAAIAKATGIPVVSQLRSGDIALGGQGAPIVPIADKWLFPEYTCLLNLGGIANITLKTAADIIQACDICPANQVLDHYARKAGRPYDKNGAMASAGSLNMVLLETLSELAFYRQRGPKSLDNGFSRETVIPIIDRFDLAPEDILNTYCEHIAMQISNWAQAETSKNPARMLITGGGAFNVYLVERIQALFPAGVHVPPAEIVEFKEALAMAFMAVLRWRGEANVLASVTGASKDSCCGSLHMP